MEGNYGVPVSLRRLPARLRASEWKLSLGRTWGLETHLWTPAGVKMCRNQAELIVLTVVQAYNMLLRSELLGMPPSLTSPDRQQNASMSPITRCPS